ncbi:MAG: TPM domain-containing protein [Clostridia bacterium]|nr:TPM domain-containing protein [Clostridia bacterium]
MMNKIKFARILVLFSIMFVVCFSCAKCVVQPTKNFYINDYAGILNQETQDYVLNNSVALCEKTDAQVVVVTVKNLENKKLEEYALDLARNWGIGSSEKGNGLLILLALQERKVRVEVGKGLEGCLNDSKVKRIINDCGVPYFKKDDWNTGVKVLYTEFLTRIYSEYNIEMPEEVDKVYSSYTTVDNSMKDIVKVVIFVLIAIVGGFAFCVLVIALRKPKDFFTIHTYGINRNDIYDDDSDDDDDNYHDSYFGGGGFWDSGSSTGSGSFWDGGGFSGGGGDFFGGGASGDF